MFWLKTSMRLVIILVTKDVLLTKTGNIIWIPQQTFELSENWFEGLSTFFLITEISYIT